MIAVAVAMSVIIFMWSQGFLSQTSESVGGQQGSQNQAAQSSIAIETALFTVAAGTDTTSIPKFTVVVRNVGAVAVTLGSITVQGLSANSGFTGSLTYTWTSTASTDITETSGTWTIGTGTDTSSEVQVAKAAAVTVVLTESVTTLTSSDNTYLRSGDVVTIKVATSVGTFAQSTYTVP
jgi:hypothetical protein